MTSGNGKAPGRKKKIPIPRPPTPWADRLAQKEAMKDIVSQLPGPSSSVSDRVGVIAQMMALGLYEGFPTRAILSEAWGVTDAAIRKYSAEAARMVAVDPDERRLLQETSAVQCLAIKDMALSMTSQVTGLPDFNAALHAIEIAGRFRNYDVDPRPPPDEDRRPQRLEIVLLDESDKEPVNPPDGDEAA